MTKLEQVPDPQLPPLLRIAGQINQQRELAPLTQTVLKEAQVLADAEAGILWLYREQNGEQWLDGVRHSSRVLEEVIPDNLAGLRLPLDDDHAARPAVKVAYSGASLYLHQDVRLDAQDCTLFAPLLVSPLESLLSVPLRNHEGVVVGVLQLANPHPESRRRGEPLTESVPALLEALAGYAGIALNNLLLVQELRDLLDAFVKVIARAIDAKSSHTSAHCQRVPWLTEMLARAACDDQTEFADFQLDEDELYELSVAAWLHDCGKLATPDSLLDKSTKLHTLHDRIETVAARFAVLRGEAKHRYERDCLIEPEHEPRFRERLEKTLQTLSEDLSFLERVNQGGESMASRDQARVRRLAETTWTDASGRRQRLLSEDEVENLCIPRGTLTKEERRVINGHIDVTLEMLESLPFPRKLQRVPEYAGGHHEHMDGSGFPRGLTGEQMSVPARIMAIADVFEALTARERPYKAPLKLSQALAIMQRMRDDHHIDPDLYRLFLEAGVWRDYAHTALDPEQLDVQDVSAYY